jgi:hypothetical protein
MKRLARQRLLACLPVIIALAPTAAMGDPGFRRIVLDEAYIAYLRDARDIDGDGDSDIIGIRNWNSAPTYIYRNERRPAGQLDRPAGDP